MNTPAHLIIGAAAFARPDAKAVNASAVLGSLAPDVSLYVLVFNAIFIQGMSERTVFGEMYFSDEWQRVFAIDNSFFVWLAVLLAGMALRKRWILVFGAAALIHLALDMPLHHDDGRQHFWPFSDWVFSSPVSYWDPTRHGLIVGSLEALVCIALCALLWRRFSGWPARAMTVAAGTAEIVSSSLPFVVTLLFR